jgi:hypothetical protein
MWGCILEVILLRVAWDVICVEAKDAIDVFFFILIPKLAKILGLCPIALFSLSIVAEPIPHILS